MKADLVLDDAAIVTVDPARPRARWLAVLGGRIVALGDDQPPPARRVLRLDGATVVPGFHDAHVHTIHYGRSLQHLDLRSPGVSSLDEVYARVREAAARREPGSWIVGENYDQNKIGGHPRLAELDRAAPDHFVQLSHTSRHMCVVNSRVLRELRLDVEPDPPGGHIERDRDGRPSGLLLESAMDLLRPLTWPVSTADMTDAIEVAHRRYVSEGLTAVQEAGVGRGLTGSSPGEALGFQVAREQNRLLVRTTLMPACTGAEELDGADGDDLFGFGLGVRTGFGDAWLRLGALKVFADGSLIGRSAAMQEPYHDDPDNRGMLAMEPAELDHLVARAHASGWQLAVHAIGDRAIDRVLDAYTNALSRRPRSDHRHRVEHAGVVSPHALERMLRLGVIPNPQGRFIGEIGDGMIRALGKERLGNCYRGRSFLTAGIELPASSDRPVVDGTPLYGIHDLVNRRTDNGVPLAPEEGLTAEQALRAYTYGSAHATFMEAELGSLAPGKRADMAVLSDDLTRVDPSRIREIQVLATFLEGTVAFDRCGTTA